MSSNEKEILTTPEVAAIFSVTPTTITKWRKAGRLKALKLARNVVRFSRADLTDFIREQSGS